MQFKAPLYATFVCAALAHDVAMAEPLACRSGYTHVTITEGSAVTVNLSATKQAGQVCLKMADDRGRQVFDDCGALVGTVTATDAYGNPTRFSHTAVFELLESFKTYDDAPFYGVPVEGSDCAFNVGERFTKLKWGTGVFQGGALNVEALGVVSFCPLQNKNTFVLSGEACLKLK